jgi:hypothetical protein
MPRPTQSGGTIDPELLQRQREEEEKKKQKQAEAARPKKAKETQSQKRTRNPIGDALTAADQAIENFVEKNIAEPLVGKEKRQQQKAAAEKKKEEVQEGFERAAYDGPVNTFGSEVIRSVVNAPVNLLEGVLNTSELIKDSIGTGINAIRGKETPDERNPFSNRYEEARYDLGVRGPKTPVGKLGEGILTFGLGLRAVGARLPKGLVGLGTGGKGIKGAVASGIVPGAIADLLLTKGDDGNLSTLVRDLDWIPPEHEDTFLLALAVEDDDNIWEAKLKTVLEGGITGAAADALGWMLVGRRAAQKALKAGKSKEEALRAGTEAAEDAAKQADAKATTRDLEEQDRWALARGEEFAVLREQEDEAARLADRVLADFGEDSPEYAEAMKSLEDINKQVADFDWEEARRIDPQGLDPHEKAVYNEAADINDAAAAQLKAETGGIPKNARVPGANYPGTSSITAAGSPKVLTDAAYRIMDMPGETEKMVRDFVKKSDLQIVANRLKRSYKQVVRDAATLVEDFRDATLRYDESTTPITELLKDGTIQVNRGTGMETLLSPEGVVATKALISDTANQIFDLATNLDAMIEIRTAGGNQYDRLVDRLIGLVELHKITGNFHGFSLGAFQESIFGAPRAFSPAEGASEYLSIAKVKDWGMRVKKLARQGDPAAQEELDRLVRAMVLAGGDPSKKVTFMHLATKLGTENLLKGMYQSMLSGPITHIRNTVGNTYATIERPFSVALNGFMTGDEAKKKAAIAGFHAVRSSMGDAWAVARQSFLTGEPLHINRKFVLDDAELMATIETMKRAANSPSEQLAIGFLEAQYRFLNNPMMSLPSRLLMASDDFFKQLSARQRLASEAMYKAALDTPDPNQVDAVFQKYLREYSKKMDPKTGEILDPELLEYADISTFQGDPGSFLNKLTVALEEVPLARIFVPFIRTPANILSYAGQHTPGLNRALSSYKNVMNGSDELLKAEMKGREAIGAMTIGAAATLALTGMMTGNGPVDKDERALWSKTHQPLSLKVGDRWISYQTLEPLASIMATVADIVLLARMGNQNMAEKLVGQTIYALTAAITEKSYLAGLSGLSAALDPANLSSGDRVLRGMLTTANNFLPFAGARRGLANALDPYMKEVDNELQRALNDAVPLYRNFQPSRTDVFTGEKMQTIGGGIWNAIMPFRVKDAGEDIVQDTLVAMQYEFNQLTKSGPSGEPLTAEEQATYSQLIFESGIRDRLERLIAKDWFRQSIMDYNQRPGALDKRDTRHYIAVDRLVSQAKRAAFNRMRAENEDFAERMLKRRQAETKARRGDVTGAIERLNQLPK